MTTQLGDIHRITTFDGKTLTLFDQDVRLIAYGNYGAPPTNFQTRRGYLQDGETEVGFLLDPRTITLLLFRAAGCDRQTYWDRRHELHMFLRPNRNGPMTFVLTTPNGSQRALTVRAHPGLLYPPPPTEENTWITNETFEMIAFDPLWFNPTQVVKSQVAGSDVNLVFPITFDTGHIVFGVAGAASNLSITYLGDWDTYPIITLTGPYQTATIYNTSLNVFFALNIPIIGGEKRIIDLTPGAQKITDGFGVNKFSDLSPNSDLVDFRIRPDPIVPGGVNLLQCAFTGGSIGASAMQVAYYERFFAL